MSFGFGVGDFIAIINQASKLRKAFVGAPSQCKELSDELRSLQSVIHDVDVDLSTTELNSHQRDDLTAITKCCRDTLTDIENVIKKYSAKESHSIRRIWRRATWDPDELRHLRDRVCVNVGNLNAFNGKLARIQISDVLMNMSDEQDQMCLDWLSSTDYATQQGEYSSLRQPGSGQWFLDSQLFHEWIKVPQQTLFCPGIPGAGKTIIVSTVIDELNNMYRDNPEVGIAYIYCDFQYIYHERQKVNFLLACIIRQLLQSMQKMTPGVLKMFNNHKSKGTRPSTKELSEALLSVTKAAQQVFIIIDALDELNDSKKILDEIFDLQVGEKVSLLATARFIPDIVARFQGMPLLEIQASRDDVSNYLSTSLEAMPYLSRKPGLHPEIIKGICDAVDGMFLLARLYLNSLSGKLSPKAIRTELRKLTNGSQTYDDAYDNTMQRIIDQKAVQTMALHVLAWVTCAKRPLTATELQHALAVELGEPHFDEDNLSDIEDLISICAGLITTTVDGTRNVIRLVHYTAQEYFEHKLVCWLPEPQQTIGTACITYISYEAFGTGSCLSDAEFEERLEKYPLYTYAARNWGYHVHDEPVADTLLLVFLLDQSKTDACGQAVFAQKGYVSHGDYSLDVPLGMTGLHLVAYFGLAEMAKVLLERRDWLSVTDSLDKTPFEWAATRGQDEIVKLFLDRGIDANYRGLGCRSPIALAASGGWISTIELLLDYGVEVNSRCKHGRSVISWAASEGHRDVVQLLLERGAAPDSKDEKYRTPLWWAVALDWPQIVVDLLQRGCDPNSIDIYGRTALCEAAENGHVAVVEILLKAGANTDIKDRDGRTALSFALQHDHGETSRILRGHPSETMWLRQETTHTSFVLKKSQQDAMPNSWDTPEITRSIGRGGTALRCPFCVKGLTVMNLGVLTRHIKDAHFPQWQYQCPKPGCSIAQRRKDKIQSHVRIHPGYSGESFNTHEFPVPSVCPLCGIAIDSWDLFYSCVVKHVREAK